MSIKESVFLALTSLRTNKMRSFLTLLGVIIGIAAVIAIMTLSASLKNQFQQNLDDAGINNLNVDVTSRPADGEEDAEDPAAMYGSGGGIDSASLISPDQLDQLREHMGDMVTGIGVGENSATFGKVSMDNQLVPQEVSATTRGINPDMALINNDPLSAGRDIESADIDGARPVAVLNADLADKLFGANPHNALGQFLEFTPEEGNAVDLMVVGVKAREESAGLPSVSTQDLSLTVSYPLAASYSKQPGAGEAFNHLTVQVADSADKQAAADRLRAALDEMYADNDAYHAKVTDFSQDMASFNQVITSLSIGLAAIGGISLLVGGIGVMNIMLITVTERTREIGVRKALGATRRDIRWQFVTEAIIVCLVGGVIGIILGALAGMAGSAAMGLLAFPPLSAVVISLLFALAIGLFFGYYPAGKAAKLDPIEALRYE